MSFTRFLIRFACFQMSFAYRLTNARRRVLQPVFGALALVALSAVPRAFAQAMPTASKTNDISAFGGYSYANPMYGPDYDQGFTFGVNFVQHLHHIPIDPSLEARVNILSGTDVSERSYLFGVRAQTIGYFHVHPYVDFLVGVGDIHFNLTNGSTYVSDNSTVYDYGGGFDIDVYKQYQLKIDMQSQNWSLGHGTAPFDPWIGMVGVTYRFKFRDYNKQGDSH